MTSAPVYEFHNGRFFILFDKKSLCIHAFVLFAVSIILCLCLYPPASRMFTNIEFLAKNKISAIISGRIPASSNTYIYVNPRITISKDESFMQIISAEAFMQTKNGNGFEDYELSSGEIAVSGNFAKSTKLSENDSVYILPDNSSTPKQYTIKKIYNNSYGLIDRQKLNTGTILMGYDNDIAENLDMDYIIFSKDALDRVPSEITLMINRENTKTTPSIITKYIFLMLLFSIIYICAITAVSYITEYMINMNYKAVLFSIFRMGVSHRKIIKYAAYLCFALFVLPLYGALFLCFAAFPRRNFYSFALFAALSFMLSAAYLLTILTKCFSQGSFRMFKNG